MSWLRRHGWKLLLGESVLLGLIGTADLVAAYASDPAIPRSVTGSTPDQLRQQDLLLFRLTELEVRIEGLNLMVASLLWSVVVLVGFRTGRRWAYRTMWSLPGWFVVNLTLRYLTPRAPGESPPPVWFSAPVLLAIAVILLVSNRRRFTDDAAGT